MKLNIFSYQNKLILMPIDIENNDSVFFPIKPGISFGNVMLDTKSRLQISKSAFNLLKDVRRGMDSIGDLSWWKVDDGTYAFSWFGPSNRIMDPYHIEGDKDFIITDQLIKECTIIPNRVPSKIKSLVEMNAYTW
jgi:hypothetical protein